MRFLTIIFVSFLFISNGSAYTSEKEAYSISMENDAQFIESVASLFNALASLQRTIVEDLKWQKGNEEYEKIQKAISSFKKSRSHLSKALSGSELLSKQLSTKKKKEFETQLKGFKDKISDLDKRLKSIELSLEGNKLPERKFIHETIKLALAGVGFGMEVSSSKSDPAEE